MFSFIIGQVDRDDETVAEQAHDQQARPCLRSPQCSELRGTPAAIENEVLREEVPKYEA